MMSWSVVLFGISFLVSCTIYCQAYDTERNRMKTAIRRDLLKDYDKVVGPVKYGRADHQIVEFRLSVSSLVEVNTKEQLLKIDGYVMQKWIDEFLSWNPKDYKHMAYTVYSRDEIWVPDVALLNNADRSENLAGGPTKFITNVNAFKSGRMIWLSPSSFTSTCQQNVKTWPMDTQVCTLEFGSPTYSLKNLVIVPKNRIFKKGSVSNGEWTIDDIEVSNGTTDHHKCCEKSYSTVRYTLTLTRKPAYFIFYLAPPAVILSFLAMMSFFIPTESGERIGFITTILLALMVFLLMIPEYLPKTSDQLPTLGILLIFAMVIISTVLAATILIVMWHHKEGRPSKIIQSLLFPLKTMTKHKAKNPVQRKVKKVMEMMENNAEPRQKYMSNEEAMPILDDEDEITWQQVSMKMNWIFFLVISAVSIGVISLLFMK